MPQLPLPIYLEILRSASATEGPFTQYGSSKLDAAFAQIASGVADFVTAAKDVPEVGYEAARTTLEDLVHLLPMTDENPFEALLKRLEDAVAAGAKEGPKDASGAFPMPAGKAGEALKPEDADAIADEFAKLLGGLPTAEDPHDTKEG